MLPILNRLLGRKAVKHDSRTLKLAQYLTPQLPPPPPEKNWTDGVLDWGMMLNNQLGCCTIAGAAHAIQIWSRNATTEITVGDNDVLLAYQMWDGYNPSDPSTDCGGIELDVLNNWRKTGLAGHKLNAFASVNVFNITEVQQAITLFGGVYVGLALPLTANYQLNNNQIWDVDLTAGNDNNPGSWGGHCVFVCAYDAVGPICITWGKLQQMTWAFWNKYCDEAYALFGTDWINTGGSAPSGFSADQLASDLSQIR